MIGVIRSDRGWGKLEAFSQVRAMYYKTVE